MACGEKHTTPADNITQRSKGEVEGRRALPRYHYCLHPPASTYDVFETQLAEEDREMN